MRMEKQNNQSLPTICDCVYERKERNGGVKGIHSTDPKTENEKKKSERNTKRKRVNNKQIEMNMRMGGSIGNW